jgi:hypothetical protein
MIFSHKDTNRAYNFIYNKFFAKFETIKANKLNHAGRLQYVNYLRGSIPIYYMSIMLFSKTFIEKMNNIIRRFGGLVCMRIRILVPLRTNLGIIFVGPKNKEVFVLGTWRP